MPKFSFSVPSSSLQTMVNDSEKAFTSTDAVLQGQKISAMLKEEPGEQCSCAQRCSLHFTNLSVHPTTAQGTAL